jgi:hypothetical protein
LESVYFYGKQADRLQFSLISQELESCIVIIA